jgi:hypothetical protein
VRVHLRFSWTLAVLYGFQMKGASPPSASASSANTRGNGGNGGNAVGHVDTVTNAGEGKGRGEGEGRLRPVNAGEIGNKKAGPRRLAICFFGVSMFALQILPNFQATILSFFREQGWEIVVFIVAQDQSEHQRDELIEAYSPVKYAFVKPNCKRNCKVVTALKLLRNHSRTENIVYNNIMMLRWGIWFHVRFCDLSIQWDTMNLGSMLESNNIRTISDNFYLFPVTHLAEFLALQEANEKEQKLFPNPCGHYQGKPLLKIFKTLNFVCNEGVHLREMHFYTLYKYRKSTDTTNKLTRGGFLLDGNLSMPQTCGKGNGGALAGPYTASCNAKVVHSGQR